MHYLTISRVKFTINWKSAGQPKTIKQDIEKQYKSLIITPPLSPSPPPPSSLRYVQQDVGLHQLQLSRECPVLQDLPRTKVWTQGIRLRRRRCWPQHGHWRTPRVSVAAAYLVLIPRACSGKCISFKIMPKLTKLVS